MPLTAGQSTEPLPTAITLERHRDHGAVRSEWHDLAERGGNVFMSWEWAAAWRRHLGGRFSLVTLLLRRADGTAQAVVPLYLERTRPLPVLRFVGAGPSDELGPVCAPEDRAATATLLGRHFGRVLPGGGLLLAERLGCRPPIAEPLGGTVVHRAASPVLEIAGRSFEDYLVSRSSNFRSQLRRSERRLVREHRLEYRLTTDPERLAYDMETLIDLHHRRWPNGEADAFAGPRRAFHLDFARNALNNGWLRLWTMDLDGRPAAAWYGLRFGGVDHYYQSGRDPRLAPLKVGFVLLAHTIRSAFEDGMSEYRFGLGNEAYKGRFCSHDPGLETVAVASGLLGRAGLVSLRAGLRAREFARAAPRIGARWPRA
jgi:CelD/BcsL family acetyltransferase involved in cellulose biosynthesis